MRIHTIYPSSKVTKREIDEYGWRHIEDIPTIVNEAGRLAPTQERSELHRSLREGIDQMGLVAYATSEGEHHQISDFAIALSPSDNERLAIFGIA